MRYRFVGCLIGQCLGDALGFPVEGCAPELCEPYAETMLKAAGSADAASLGRFGGQYTDDSQLARELLQSYVRLGRFDPADYADRIAALFRDRRVVGRGRATSEAAQRLIDGVPWDAAGTPPPSAGNGSAMRAAPIGLLFWDDPDGMVVAAHDQGRITHLDPRCSAGAVAIAGAVALALQGPVEVEIWGRQLSAWSGAYDETLGQALRALPELSRMTPQQALRMIRSVGKASDYDNGWEGISPFVTGSVLWSLYAFLHSPNDYLATVATAIAVGGDVDTTAAMAGAISGAYLGFDAIPPLLAAGLNDQGTWRVEALVALAEQAYSIRRRSPRRPS